MISLGNNPLVAWLDAVFPRFCVTCGEEGGLLCKSCGDEWWPEPPAATVDHVALFAYANPTVRKLICAWKYDYDQSAFAVLKAEAQKLLPKFKQTFYQLGVKAIVPMPLSAHRFRERGFNQSRLIAQWLSEELDVPIIQLLERVHRRGHQAERSVQEREAAMTNNPFLLKFPKPLPEVVLLVDDVWTTGATMSAAKNVLESGEKTQVFAFTLAKG